MSTNVSVTSNLFNFSHACEPCSDVVHSTGVHTKYPRTNDSNGSYIFVIYRREDNSIYLAKNCREKIKQATEIIVIIIVIISGTLDRILPAITYS